MDLSTSFTHTLESMTRWGNSPHIAVGVSGGVDSMVLTHLLDHWLKQKDGKLTAFTVNHNLRPEAAAEAIQVARWLEKLNIDHHILSWENTYKPGNIQAQARTARYTLMSQACHEKGILTLATAHHTDDQLETVHYRQQRGSTAFGLAGMPQQQIIHRLHLIRPLLHIPKQAILEYAQANDIPSLDDPSNINERFARTHAREALKETLQKQTITTLQNESETQRHIQEEQINQLLQQAVVLHPFGFAILNPAPYKDKAESIRLRTLSQLLQTVSGSNTPARKEELLNADRAIQFDQKTTLSGCILKPYKGFIYCIREPSHAENQIITTTSTIWDSRIKITLPANVKAATLKPLGSSGWKQFKAAGGNRLQNSLPMEVYYALPAVFDLEKLVAIPHLNYGMEPVEPLYMPVFASPNPLAVQPFRWYAQTNARQ